MSTAELLQRLQAADIKLTVAAGRLSVSAPKGRMTPALRAELAANKSALIELLQDSAEVQTPATAPIPRANREQALPLSHAQQRIWFLEELEGGSSVYNIPWAVQIRGVLDPDTLERALRALQQRHESLRTTFIATDAGPRQQIQAATDITLERARLPAASAVEIQAQVAAWASQQFDLRTGPLLRAGLLEAGRDHWVLTLVIHHIVIDGWSLEILQRELFTLYTGYAAGDDVALPALPLQLADYAVWQREQVASGAFAGQLRYWLRQLAGAAPVLSLPTDMPRPAEQSYRGARIRRALPGDLSRALTEFATERGVTLFMLLLASFQVLLARYSGQTDIVVGTPIAGRQRTELEGLIGLFLNTLALRSDLSSDPPFGELLATVQANCLDAFARQDLPFDRIVEALETPRNLAHAPVFQVQFVLQNAPGGGHAGGGLSFAPVEFDYGTAKFDLTLAMAETAQGLVAEIEYCSDLFVRATIEQLLGHLEVLLRGIVAHPDLPVSRLPLMTPQERSAALTRLQGPTASYPSTATLHSLVEEQVRLTPDACALQFADLRLSYTELNARANQLAHWLRRHGIGAGASVGIYLQRSPTLVVSLLGTLKAGAAYVPLDPDYPPQRLQHMLDDAGIERVLTTTALAGDLATTTATVSALDTLGTELSAQDTANPDCARDPDELAYIIFTSGSTGRPKGVMNTHRGICNRLLWMQDEYELNASDRVLQKTPFSFDVSVWEFFWPLLTGATLVVARPDGHKDTTYLCDIIRAHGITTLHFVPTMLQVFLEDPQAAMCGSLKRVICSGEALPYELQTRFYLTLDAELHNLYGPTEAAVDVTHWACPRDSREPLVPIGYPVANTPLYVVEPSGEPAPPGVAGELWIGGVQVARGYAGRPDLTAERFTPDPFAAAATARVYRTGDLARLRHDGALEFLGRIDHQVKLRGLRIELGEIEAALDAVPSVRQSVVLLRTDAPAPPRLVAYLTAATDAPASALRAALADSLPDYMLPAAFVTLPSFPLLANGKVDRAALPAPDAQPEVAATYVPPTTPVETTLVEIWSELLQVEHVGIDDNFFELGGDSILSIQIIARAARAGIRLQPKHVFRYQTIAELAGVAEETTGTTAGQGLIAGTAPLTPIQEWLFATATETPQHFNQSIRLTVNAALSADVIERALSSIVLHHDALRLRFERAADGWLQSFAAPTDQPLLEVLELATTEADAHEPEIITAANALQSGFDIRTGPLLKGLLITANQQARELIIAVHHLAMDGLSWRILLEDLTTACEQLGAGTPPALPPKTSSFQDWAVRLRRYADSAELHAEAAYWLAQPWQKFAAIPQDNAGGANLVASAATAQVRLPPALTSQLLTQSSGAFRTQINDLLLAAFARAWHAWCGQRGVLVDMEGHGREDIFAELDITRTLGWFTTLYPVALQADQPGWETLIKSTKEQLRGIPKQGLGFGVLRYLSTIDLAAVAQPQILFNYLGQFDQSFATDGLFGMAAGGRGYEQAPQRPRSHLLEINGGVYGGELQVSLIYSSEIHNPESIADLAQQYQSALEELIEFCASPEHRGATPSDFPLADLNQSTLDGLLRAYPDAADIYPVTALQHGMLFQSQFSAPDTEQFSDVYLTQVIWTLEGPLDAAAFSAAWQQVSARHPALRTAFDLHSASVPLAIVRSDVRPELQTADWRLLAPTEQTHALDAALEADRQRSFGFAEAPLLRLYLYRCADESYRFVWSHHHIIMDGWSIPVVLGEVFTVYAALTANTGLRLPPVRDYRNYIEWLGRQDRNAAEAHWRGALGDFNTTTPLPGAQQATDAAASASYSKSFQALSPATTAQLRATARQLRVTLNTLAQGMWALLLSRYSGATDVVFGATTSGRPAELPHVDQMVGLFLNTLPCRIHIDSEQSAVDWLVKIQTAQLAARQHEHAALTDIQSWSGVGRGQALFNTLLVFENYPEAATLIADRQGLRVVDMQARGWTSFPLSVAVSVGAQLVLRIAYDQHKFTAERIAQLGEYYCQLLTTVAEHPAARVSQLLNTAPPISALPRKRPAPIQTLGSSSHSLIELFEQQVSARPDAPAVCGWAAAPTGTVWSYAELNAKANAVAQALLQLELPLNSRVGLLQDHDGPMIAAVLGTLKAGHAYVPLDPQAPQRRLAHIATDTGIAALLHTPGHRELAAALSATAVDVDAVAPVSSEQNPELTVPDDALAYILTTSGSTGRPKGVMQTRGNTAQHALNYANAIGIRVDDTLSLFSTYGFDAAVMDIFGALLVGGSVCPIDIRRTESAAEVRAALGKLGVTILHATPTVYRYLFAGETRADLPQVRAVVLGGEQARPADLQTFKRCFARGARFVNGLGLTESTLVLQYFADHDTPVPDDALPVGQPVAGTEVVLLDEQQRPTSLTGELGIYSAWITPGYWNDPEQTTRAFVTDAHGRRLYRTGDLARYNIDGDLIYCGRRDAQLKVRGHRIEPGEIEHALASAAGVAHSTVLLMTDAAGVSRLTAYVVPESGSTLAPAELRAWIAARLPDYMVPAAIVELAALPLTPNGKLDHRQLPLPVTGADDGSYVPPRNELESTMASIWSSVLRVERVGITDNFFALGGHSLNATQLVARLRETLATEFPLRALFDHPTIAGLITHVQPARIGAYQSLAPRPDNVTVPLSLPQQRLWFVEQLQPDSSVYVLSWANRVPAELQLDLLQAAVDALVARHESLRTCFVATDSGPVQHIEPTVALPVGCSRLESADPATLSKRLAEIAHQPFDLGKAPLLRVHLLELGSAERVLAFGIHHIMSDNWSIQVLMRDLLTLYQSALSGEPAELPALPLQYGDYAVWQRAQLTAAELQRQRTYWLEQLGDAPLVLELPADRPRPPTQTHRGSQVHWQLADGTAARLREVARSAGCSPFMTLISVYALLLARYSGKEDLLIGTPIAGRPHSQLENLIGFFVNMLTLRFNLSGDPRFSDLLARTRTTTLSAFAHQELPFEQLIEALQPERDMSRSPVFQVAFILQNAPTPGAALSRLLGDPVAVTHANSKFDLTLGMWETEHALGGSFEYNADLFDRGTIERLSEHFCSLLQAVAVTPDATLSDLDMLPAGERQQVVHDWNDTHRDYPRGSIQQRFEAQVEHGPQRAALTCAGQTLSYAELNRRANRLAHYLLAQELPLETPIALCLERGIDAVVSILAILKAGCAYVPLDPAYPLQRLQFMLDDTASPVLLTQAALNPELGGANCLRLNLDLLEPELATGTDSNPNDRVTGEQLAYIVYTSGSTGVPKGVLIEQRSVLALVVNTDFAPLDAGLRIGMLAPISFDASTMEIWGALLNGGECIIFPARVPEISSLRPFFAQHPLDLLFLTTGLFNTIIDAEPEMLCNVGQLLTGGEAMSLRHIRRAAQHLPNTRLANIYGPTEATTYATVFPIPPELPDRARIPIGRPIANTTVYILDDRKQPAAVGTPGELYVGGDGLARGYLGQPALTAERFVPHPFAAGKRLYKTGDLVRWLPDGAIEFLGRKDTQIKLRGFRIELGEVEAALRQHATVRDALALVYEISSTDRRLVAYLVAAEGSAIDTAAVSAFLAEQLPDYMRPAALLTLSAIPLTANGKVDRARLPEPEWVATERYTAPRTATEIRLCALWQELLNVTTVGVHDDFFELGGHSLLTITLLDRIEKGFGQRLRVATVFANPTVADIAALLDQDAPSEPAADPGAPSGTLLPIRTAGSRPPLFCIHGEPLKMARALAAEQPLYGVYFSYDPDFRMPDTLAALAALYIKELRRVQPHGPYHIVGYCLGGLAAFEMARQLHAAGETIGYLALIDPTNPELSLTRREWLVRSFSIPGQRLKALRFFAKRAVQSLLSRAQYGARIAATYAYELAGKEIPFLLREVRHTGKARSAFSDYRYAELPLAGFIFRPDMNANDAARLQRYWETKFAGGANLITVPGLKDHLEFMQEPFHTDVSAMIEAQMAEIHGTESHKP